MADLPGYQLFRLSRGWKPEGGGPLDERDWADPERRERILKAGRDQRFGEVFKWAEEMETRFPPLPPPPPRAAPTTFPGLPAELAGYLGQEIPAPMTDFLGRALSILPPPLREFIEGRPQVILPTPPAPQRPSPLQGRGLWPAERPIEGRPMERRLEALPMRPTARLEALPLGPPRYETPPFTPIPEGWEMPTLQRELRGLPMERWERPRAAYPGVTPPTEEQAERGRERIIQPVLRTLDWLSPGFVQRARIGIVEPAQEMARITTSREALADEMITLLGEADAEKHLGKTGWPLAAPPTEMRLPGLIDRTIRGAYGAWWDVVSGILKKGDDTKNILVSALARNTERHPLLTNPRTYLAAEAAGLHERHPLREEIDREIAQKPAPIREELQEAANEHEMVWSLLFMEPTFKEELRERIHSGEITWEEVMSEYRNDNLELAMNLITTPWWFAPSKPFEIAFAPVTMPLGWTWRGLKATPAINSLLEWSKRTRIEKHADEATKLYDKMMQRIPGWRQMVDDAAFRGATKFELESFADDMIRAAEGQNLSEVLGLAEDEATRLGELIDFAGKGGFDLRNLIATSGSKESLLARIRWVARMEKAKDLGVDLSRDRAFITETMQFMKEQWLGPNPAFVATNFLDNSAKGLMHGFYPAGNYEVRFGQYGVTMPSYVQQTLAKSIGLEAETVTGRLGIPLISKPENWLRGYAIETIERVFGKRATKPIVKWLGRVVDYQKRPDLKGLGKALNWMLDQANLESVVLLGRKGWNIEYAFRAEGVLHRLNGMVETSRPEFADDLYKAVIDAGFSEAEAIAIRDGVLSRLVTGSDDVGRVLQRLYPEGEIPVYGLADYPVEYSGKLGEVLGWLRNSLDKKEKAGKITPENISSLFSQARRIAESKIDDVERVAEGKLPISQILGDIEDIAAIQGARRDVSVHRLGSLMNKIERAVLEGELPQSLLDDTAKIRDRSIFKGRKLVRNALNKGETARKDMIVAPLEQFAKDLRAGKIDQAQFAIKYSQLVTAYKNYVRPMWDKTNDDFVRIISAGIERIQRTSNIFEEPLSQELVGKLARVEAIMSNVKATFREQFLGEWLDDATKLTDEIGKWEEWSLRKLAPAEAVAPEVARPAAGIQELAQELYRVDTAHGFEGEWVAKATSRRKILGQKELYNRLEELRAQGLLERYEYAARQKRLAGREIVPYVHWRYKLTEEGRKLYWQQLPSLEGIAPEVARWRIPSGEKLDELVQHYIAGDNSRPVSRSLAILDDAIDKIEGHSKPGGLLPFAVRLSEEATEALQLESRFITKPTELHEIAKKWEELLGRGIPEIAEIAKPARTAAETRSTVAKLIETFSNRWQEIIDNGMDEGIQYSKDIFFDYGEQMALEERARWWTPFIHWQILNPLYWLKHAQEMPWIPNAIRLYEWETDQHRQERGLSTRFRWTAETPLHEWMPRFFPEGYYGTDFRPFMSVLTQLGIFTPYKEPFRYAEEDDAGKLLRAGEWIGLGAYPWWQALEARITAKETPDMGDIFPITRAVKDLFGIDLGHITNIEDYYAKLELAARVAGNEIDEWTAKNAIIEGAGNREYDSALGETQSIANKLGLIRLFIPFTIKYASPGELAIREEMRVRGEMPPTERPEPSPALSTYYFLWLEPQEQKNALAYETYISRINEMNKYISTQAQMYGIGTKRWRTTLDEYWENRDKVRSEYEEAITPEMSETMRWILAAPMDQAVRSYRNLTRQFFDEEGELKEDYDWPDLISAQELFKRELVRGTPERRPMSLLAFEQAYYKWEIPEEAVLRAWEKLYGAPVWEIISATEELEREQADKLINEAKRIANQGRNNKSELMAEIMRIHPDWERAQVEKALKVDLPHWDAWARRNRPLEDALWSTAWSGYMGLSDLDRKEFREFMRQEHGPQLADIIEKVWLPRERLLGDKAWQRDKKLVPLKVLLALNERLDQLGALAKEGFAPEIAAARKEVGLEIPGKPYEEVPEEEAKRYDLYRLAQDYYWDLRATDPDAARAFTDQPQVKALYDEFDTSASRKFWETYYTELPPGRISEEIRNDTLVQLVLGEREAVTITDEQHAEATKRIQDWLKEHPDVAGLGDTEEWAQVRLIIKEWARLRYEEENVDAARQLWNSYKPLLDKYYPPERTSARPPGMAGPPIPTEPELTRGQAAWGQRYMGFAGAEQYAKEARVQELQPTGPLPRGIPLDHPSNLPVHQEPPTLEARARQQKEGEYQDYLSSVETGAFKDWVFKEAGFTPESQQELQKVELQVKRSIGGGGGWIPLSQSIELGAPSLEGAIHEYSHVYWQPRRKEEGDALVQAAMQLAKEIDPQYETASMLARAYIQEMQLEDGTVHKPVMLLEERNWGQGSGPDKKWNDWEIFAGLASGVMGHLEMLPDYIKSFYEGLFSGQTGKYATRENKTEPYADFWPAMAIREQGRGGGGITGPDRGGGRQLRGWWKFLRLGGPEIARAVEEHWETGRPLGGADLNYLQMLYQKESFGQKSFEGWLDYLRFLAREAYG